MFKKLKKMEEGIYKKTSHFIFFATSMFFTVSLFLNFSEDIFMRGLYLLFAVAVELLKNYLIRLIKTDYKVVSKWMTTGFLVSYFITAVISGVATFGSVRGTLEEQKAYVERQNSSTKFVEDDIEAMDSVVETLIGSLSASSEEKQKLNSLEGAYYTGQERLTNDLNNSLENIKEFLTIKQNYVDQIDEKNEKVESEGFQIFTLIGESFGLSGEQVLMGIFVTLILVLELALFLTGDAFEKDTTHIKEKTELEEIKEYIDNLEKEGSVVLNSNATISEITGIPIPDCKRYRKLLAELKWRGKPLISKKGGSMRQAFNTSTLKRVVEDYFSKEEK